MTFSKTNKIFLVSVFSTLVVIGVSLWLWRYIADLSLAATVNGAGIEQEYLDDEVASRKHFQEVNNQDSNNEDLEQDTLRLLVDKELIERYADVNNIYVQQQELDEYYLAKVASAGSEDELLSEIYRLYGIDKNRYLLNLSYDILRSKVQSSLDVPLQDWLIEVRNNSRILLLSNS